MYFAHPNPKIPNTGYDDGFFGHASVALAVHSIVAKSQMDPLPPASDLIETFILAPHHLGIHGDKIISRVTIRCEWIGTDLHVRYSGSESTPWASLDGRIDPRDDLAIQAIEISRAVAHLARILQYRACKYGEPYGIRELSIYRQGT